MSAPPYSDCLHIRFGLTISINIFDFIFILLKRDLLALLFSVDAWIKLKYFVITKMLFVWRHPYNYPDKPLLLLKNVRVMYPNIQMNVELNRLFFSSRWRRVRHGHVKCAARSSHWLRWNSIKLNLSWHLSSVANLEILFAKFSTFSDSPSNVFFQKHLATNLAI